MDESFMDMALAEARAAAARQEVPIGAVLVDPATGRILARDGNRTRELNDPTAHAEILVIREACRLAGAQRIPEFDLYVTLEPCALCAAAVSFARLRRVVYAAADPKSGGIDHGGRFFSQLTCHHRPLVDSGLRADEASALLRDFFSERR